MTDLELAIKTLEQVQMGLSHPENKCWPTPKAWTKKERDETMLQIVRVTLDVIKRRPAAIPEVSRASHYS